MATTTVTAQQVQDRALKLIVAAGGASSVSGDVAVDFIFAMNQFVAEIESHTYTDTTVTPNVTYGNDLSWTAITDGGDTLTIDDGAVAALIDCMAKEVAPEFGVVLPPEMEQRARKGRRVLLRLARSGKGTAFSDRLPWGSGNEDDGANYGSGHFYATGEQ